MNTNNKITIVGMAGVLMVVLLLSGASYSQKGPSTTSQVEDQIQDTPGINRETLYEEERGDPDKSDGANNSVNGLISVQAGVDEILSAELAAANEDQASVSSTDSEDRALMTSDVETFGGVGALGGEYAYE